MNKRLNVSESGPPQREGLRLDLFLKRCGLVKRRTQAKELCDAGGVAVNGREAKASREVLPGDVLHLRIPRPVPLIPWEQGPRQAGVPELAAPRESEAERPAGWESRGSGLSCRSIVIRVLGIPVKGVKPSKANGIYYDLVETSETV
jgi:ribosomal 50S subunit-recycling heat shock protein